MKTMGRHWITRLAAMLCTVASTTASAADRHVTIINETGYTIVRFYASSENARSWEEDILGDATLKPNKSIRINIDDGTGACMFDFKAVFSDGDVKTRSGVDVCKVSTYRYQ